MDQELKAYLDEMRAELRAGFANLNEKIEATETKLLSEFWKWGRATDQRMRRIETSDATLADRVSNMEERIFTLERKASGSKN